MKSNAEPSGDNSIGRHTVLSEEEKHVIRVAIERYKQTGKLVSLKEMEKNNRKKRSS